MAFADLYPLATFAEIADVCWWRASTMQSDHSRSKSESPLDQVALKAANDLDKADRERYDSHKVIFISAVRTHLEGLRAAGRLRKAEGLRDRDVSIAKAWNAFVDNKPDNHETSWLLDSFSKILTFRIVRQRANQRVAEAMGTDNLSPAERAHAKICEELDQGNSGAEWDGWAIECQDHKSGDRCELQFVDWQAILMRRNASHRLEPAKNLGPIPLAAADFTVPTGRLLISDTLRVEGFSDGTKFENEYGPELSLNSEVGQANRVTKHAVDHNMAYCQTTNTVVGVHFDPTTGNIAVTQDWNDEDGDLSIPGWTRLGNVSCDIWRITAIDAESARERMRAGGCANADAELDRYLEMANSDRNGAINDHRTHHEICYSQNVIQMDVVPGTYRMHAGPDFSKRFNRKKFGLPRGFHLWCLIERVSEDMPAHLQSKG